MNFRAIGTALLVLVGASIATVLVLWSAPPDPPVPGGGARGAVAGRVADRAGEPVPFALVEVARAPVLPSVRGRTAYWGNEGAPPNPDMEIGGRLEAEPLPPAAVDPHGARVSALADADGRFRIAGLAPGPVYVVASKKGFAAVRHQNRVPAGMTATADVVLEPGGFIRGRIVDAAGAPLAAQGVLRFRLAGTPETSWVDVPGSFAAGFAIDGLLPGEYELVLRPRGDAFEEARLRAAAGTEGHAVTITARPAR